MQCYYIVFLISSITLKDNQGQYIESKEWKQEQESVRVKARWDCIRSVNQIQYDLFNL